MTASSNVPLERVPQFWSADLKALRDAGIVSTEDLVQSVHENGLKSLSDSTGISPEPLQEYLTAAQASISETKTRRRATIMFSLALLVIVALSGSMLTVQAGFLPRSAAEAENAYADLHARYASATEVDHQDLLGKVTASLEELEGKADSSRVNLLLLSSALNDRIAIEELQKAGDDPTGATFAAHLENYQEHFNKARDEQARIQEIRIDDPRIAFARVNAAQAWTSRVEELGMIDLSNLPADDPKRIRIEEEIRSAQIQARREASLAGNTPNISPGLFTQRIDNMRQTLDFQAPQRLPDPSIPTEEIENIINSMQGNLDSMQEEISDMQARVADLQSPIAGLLEQMDEQESAIGEKVDGAHVETRELIGSVNVDLNSVINKIDEITFRHVTAGDECGLLDLAAARETVKSLCYPRRGLTRSVSFRMGVIPTGDGAPRIVVEDGPTERIDCDLEVVMAEFAYDNQEHHCNINFEAR